MSPPYTISDWQAEAAKARQQVLDSIPETWRLPPSLLVSADEGTLRPDAPKVLACGILDTLDQEITSIRDAEMLLRALAQGTYSAVQVATAFCKRAAIAHQCTNCLTSFFPAEALRRAADLDAAGTVQGPLHGLPVSLKDIFDIAGQPSSIGLVSWLPNIAKSNGAVADAVLAAGGVLYAKTGTSQGCLMVESINNIFGALRNPYNLALNPGGSSGGEGALLAARGGILGSGTDGGGSIRFPAMWCGLWGLKCSKGRVPGSGMASTYDGNESTNAGLGPMSSSVSGLGVWMQAVLANEPWQKDMNCIPMPWDIGAAERPQGKLRFAILWDDGVVEPTPPVTRAMNIVVSALKEAGHTTIDLPSEKMKELHRRGTSCVMKSNVQNGGRGIMKHIAASGEPVVPRTATGSAASLLTSEEIFANHRERKAIAAEYGALWQKLGIDGIISPAVAHPAPPHGKYISNAYAGMYNMLDYVTGSIPVTTVSSEDEPTEEWSRRSPYPRIEAERFPYDYGDKEMKELYTSAKVFENAPVGVQVVCQRLREEKCVGILREIEGLLASQP